MANQLKTVNYRDARLFFEYNNRWYGRYREPQENTDRTLRSLSKTDATDYVTIFDGVVLSDDSGTPLTTVALESIDRFFNDTVWFLNARDTSNSQYYLYKSVNQGVSWGNNAPLFNNNRPIVRLGFYNGTHSPFITLLASGTSRGMCELNGILYIADYNVHPSRTPGGLHDQIQIYKSTDQGDSWQVIFEQNTDGNNYWRHFHCIVADPYKNLLYVGFGDGGNDSGFIVWDPAVGTWLDNNVNMATITSWPGFSGAGADLNPGLHRYNATDFIPLPNSEWTVHCSDGVSDPSEWGIYRFKPTDPGGTFEQVHDFSPFYPAASRACAYGLRMDDGTLVVSEFKGGNNTSNDQFLHTSNDPDGAVWERVGVVVLRDDAVETESGLGLWKGNDGTIHYIAAAGIGRTAPGWVSISLKSNGEFVGQEPNILDPTFWVNNVTGDDAANAVNGVSPDRPYQTLRYALVNGVRGSSIHINDVDVHNLPATVVDLSGTTVSTPNAQTIWNRCELWGEGQTKSKIVGTSDNYIFSLDTQNADPALHDIVWFRDLTVENGEANRPLWGNWTGDKVVVESCTFGTYDVITPNSGNQYAMRNGSDGEGALELYQSKFIQNNPDPVPLSLNTWGHNMIAKSCVFDGGRYVQINNTATQAIFHNCTFVNMRDAATYGLIRFGTGSGLDVRNCVFSDPTQTSLSAVYRAANTGEVLQNNHSVGPLNLMAGAALTEPFQDPGIAQDTDPEFVNPAVNDYRLQETSPMIGLAPTIVVVDRDGNLFKTPASLGAYEYYPVLVPTETGTRTGKLGKITIGTDGLLTARSWTIETTAEPIEDSVIGTEWRSYNAGLNGYTFSIEGYYNVEDAGQLNLNIGTQVDFDLWPAGEITGEKHYSGTASVTAYSETAAFDGMVEFTTTLQGTNVLAEDTV